MKKSANQKDKFLFKFLKRNFVEKNHDNSLRQIPMVDPFELYGYKPEGGAPLDQRGPVDDPFLLYGTTWEIGENSNEGVAIDPMGSYYSDMNLNPDCL